MDNPFGGASVFIWQVKACTRGAPANSAAGRAYIRHVLDTAGLRAAYVKVADGAYVYNQSEVAGGWRDDILPVLYESFGSRPRVGWHYIRGDAPEAEAERAAERIKTLRLDGYVLDPEAEFKKAGPGAARRFMAVLCYLAPDTPLALCSYRFPSYHPDFPWKAFVERMDPERGDVHMPQVYWLGARQGNAPSIQLRQSVKELKKLKKLPVIPAGSAWGQIVDGAWWEPSIVQMRDFAAAADDLDLPGLSWWSWDKLAEQDADGPGPGGKRGWWNTLRAIAKGEQDTQPAPEPDPAPAPAPEPPPGHIPAREPSDAEKLKLLWADYLARNVK